MFLSGMGRLGARRRAKKYGNVPRTIASGRQWPKIARNVRPNMQRNRTNGEFRRKTPLGNLFSQGGLLSATHIHRLLVRQKLTTKYWAYIRILFCQQM